MKKEQVVIENFYRFSHLLAILEGKDCTNDAFLYLIHKYYPQDTESYKLHFCSLASILKREKPNDEEYKNKEKSAIVMMRKWPATKMIKFDKDIENFLEKMGFGTEWRMPIITAVLTGFFYPPSQNYYLETRKRKRKKLSLEINQYTSKNDIEDAWQEIELTQKELWPSFDKRNFTKKSLGDLLFFAKANAIKKNLIEKNTDETPINDFDVVLYLFPEADPETDKKYVNWVRKNRYKYKTF
ncbi:MAG: hypothetical protein Q8P11_00235 [bacterium]|nr:hypothetical protein [bacterium]